MEGSSWVLRAVGSPGAMVADADEVRRALGLFVDPELGCELRALLSGVHRNLPGHDIEGLLKAAEEMPGGIGIYFLINPLPTGLKKAGTNADMVKRRWLYIDVDPLKPDAHKDDPSTDAEKALTGEVADSVNEHLREHDWPAPVVVDSGNGHNLLYRCDLPNDELSRAAYRRLLKTLSEKFSGSRAKIDTSVHNAARLAKLPGTWAKKGQQSDDRPHRVCRLLYVPADLGLVTFEQLSAAAGVDRDEPESPGPKTSTNGYHGPAAPGTSAYAKKALDEECARVVFSRPPSLGGDGRNNALNRAAFSLGQLVAAGLLLLSDVEARLYQAACAAGLDCDPDCGERGIWSTIRSGLAAGQAHPREKPPGKQDPKATWGKGPQSEPKPPADGPLIYWASSVKPRPVEWLWPARIPLGKLTTFAGNGGLGKTFVLCDIIARVTQGLNWPDSAGLCSEQGKCLFISGEDDPEDTLVPRMIELGADLNRVAFLKTEVLDRFTLADVPTLEAALDQMGDDTRFVAIDPPTAYLGGVDDHKNAELRGLLTPLANWAKKRRLSIVFNTHVNKPQGAKVEAMMRVMGSVAWVNAMRSAYMFARDPDDRERRLFVGMKNNLGSEVKGLGYKIAKTDTLARVEWLGEVETNADEAVNNQGGNRKRRVTAAEWLMELFANVDKLPSKTIFQSKKTTTISDDALKEAKADMRLQPKLEYDDEGERQWYWHWSKEDRESWNRRQAKKGDEDV